VPVLATQAYDTDLGEIRARIAEIIRDNSAGRPAAPPARD
jgi:hypothetical protein